MSVYHDHDCENCPVYKACGWFGDILVQPRCFVDDKCDPDIYVPDLTALGVVVEEKDKVLVAVPKDTERITVHRAKDYGDHVIRWDSTLDLEVEKNACGTCCDFPGESKVCRVEGGYQHIVGRCMIACSKWRASVEAKGGGE